MPQIILKERAAYLDSYNFFLQEMLINIKTCHFHSSINHQERLFHRTLITGHLSSCEYCKVFKNGLFYRTPLEPVVCRYSSG